jgi:glucose/arabinose dehydrogenase
MKRGVILVLYTFFAFQTIAQTPNLVLTNMGSALSEPIAVVNAGDSRLFVAEQGGLIKIYKNGAFLPTPFLNLTSIVTSTGNEQGLLGLAFSPNFSSNGFFYVNYTGGSPTKTNVVRYSVSLTNPDSALPSSAQVVLTQNQPYSNHNGGNLVFGPDGYLYIGLGDGGSANDPQGYGQNTQTQLAKMLRIEVDSSATYTVPADNPFVGNTNFLPQIWAYGLRNPWRYSFDRLTGDLWIADVGQDIYEEINKVPAGMGGQNYGWKCKEGFSTFNSAGVCANVSNLTAPIFDYPHGTAGCSVTGGFVYRGAMHKNLYGKYIYADYCNNKIYALTPQSNGTYTNALLKDVAGSGFSSFGEDMYGEMYLTDRDNNKLYRLTDTSTCNPVAQLNIGSAIATCDTTYTLTTPYNPNMAYQWNLNGNAIIGADSSAFTANQNGTYSVTVANTNNNCNSISDTVQITLGLIVQPTITGLDTLYCSNASSVIIAGTPAGGTFSGSGINGNVFNPQTAGIGTHIINYQYQLNGCNASTQFSTTISACAGINEVTNNNISIMPNPNQGTFSVGFTIHQSEAITLKVLNNLGQMVYKHTMQVNAGNITLPLQIKEAAGVYTLQIHAKTGVQQKTFVIK